MEIPRDRLPLLGLMWLIFGVATDNQLMQGSALAALFIAWALERPATLYERN